MILPEWGFGKNFCTKNRQFLLQLNIIKFIWFFSLSDQQFQTISWMTAGAAKNCPR
jgi:hypothetical protein